MDKLFLFHIIYFIIAKSVVKNTIYKHILFYIYKIIKYIFLLFTIFSIFMLYVFNYEIVCIIIEIKCVSKTSLLGISLSQ